MAYLEDLQLRPADPSDAEDIATLHADSWRRHYRGAYSDAFLDGDVISDRLVVWADRLREPDPLRYTIVVEDGGSLIGLRTPRSTRTQSGEHCSTTSMSRTGTSVEASAAVAGFDRSGGGRAGNRSLSVGAGAERRGSGLLEARGGRCVDRALISPPGGVASRLNGSPVKLRYAWSVKQLARLSAAHRSH